MTTVDDNLVRKLSSLKARTDELQAALRVYLSALRAARDAGATWAELEQATGASVGSVRARYKAALSGGEVHLRTETPVPEQRKESTP